MMTEDKFIEIKNVEIRRIAKDLSTFIDDLTERIDKPGYSGEARHWDLMYVESCLSAIRTYMDYGVVHSYNEGD